MGLSINFYCAKYLAFQSLNLKFGFNHITSNIKFRAFEGKIFRIKQKKSRIRSVRPQTMLFAYFFQILNSFVLRPLEGLKFLILL